MLTQQCPNNFRFNNSNFLLHSPLHTKPICYRLIINFGLFILTLIDRMHNRACQPQERRLSIVTGYISVRRCSWTTTTSRPLSGIYSDANILCSAQNRCLHTENVLPAKPVVLYTFFSVAWFGTICTFSCWWIFFYTINFHFLGLLFCSFEIYLCQEQGLHDPVVLALQHPSIYYQLFFLHFKSSISFKSKSTISSCYIQLTSTPFCVSLIIPVSVLYIINSNISQSFSQS